MRRRDLLAGSSALGLTACRPEPSPTRSPDTGPEAPVRRPEPLSPVAPSHSPFAHGIASGDPLADRVILWTRVTPPERTTELEARWVVAEDVQLRRVVTHGSVRVSPERDYTVKVDVTGLLPGRTYYYRFEAIGHRSAIGRTRTLPVENLSRLRLAVASCSNYPFGYFNAYAAIAQRPDLHAVLHLGDYIYELPNGVYGDGTATGRMPDPADRETFVLPDYRSRHAVYKTDPDLQQLHRQHPVIAIWDDHEFANDAWVGGAQNHQPEQEGAWSVRRAAALQAYYEWMPVRELPSDPIGQLYRRFRFGNLLDLLMLDVRVAGRSQHADWREPGFERVIADPRRTMLGFPQEAWVAHQLEQSKAEGIAWRSLGQQVPMTAMRRRSLGDWVNIDMWDGYAPARARLFDHIRGKGIDDLVVLAGDVHSSWGTELAHDPFGRGYDPVTGRGALAVEMVTPAITSSTPVPPANDPEGRERTIKSTHPHVKWVELRHRGYMLLDVDHDRTIAEWYFVDTIDDRRPEARFAHGQAVMRGKALLHEQREPTVAMSDAPAPAPAVET